MHPWHDISPGDKIPEVVIALIEIPKGSKGKYEIDKPTGLIKLDRVLYSSVHYPANYGFIPQTYHEDKDPLDILVISQIELPPRCLVEAKVIGMMRMKDRNELDDKIIAVAQQDIAVSYIDSLDELPPHTTVEIKRFFQDYKILENRKIEVEEFFGKEKAYEVIRKNIENYSKYFGGKSHRSSLNE
ncbi:MAG TPA: inorganic diphosphatase [Chitinophagales bacterium]|nr:inorganic diphosphatase [Chitinophagales bacterium]